MEDLIFAFGGAVKALPDSSVVEGLLVPFGSPDDLDHDGEFFTDRTDLGVRLPAAVKLFYHHGMNERLGRVPIAWAELERRDDGVWFKADFEEDLEWEAEERAKALLYRGHVLKMVRDGELGASSGAASHVVVRQAAGKGVRITRWPLAEASVTPTPSNARTVGTVTLKAMMDLPDTLPAGEARSLAERTERWLDDGEDLLVGYRQVSAAQHKAGRALSAARRGRLEAARQLLDDLLSETAPREVAPSDLAAPRDAAPPSTHSLDSAFGISRAIGDAFDAMLQADQGRLIAAP